MSDGSADVSRRALLRAGAGAATVATASGTAAAQEGTAGGGGGGNVRPVWPDYLSGSNDQGYEDLRGQSEVTVEVDSNFFTPTKIWVDPGTTVTWEFVAAGHNVKPDSQPASDLPGTEGGRNETLSAGSTYEATLETEGMYSYFCGPHETIGMKGAVAVGTAVETEQIGGEGGGGGEVDPEHMGVPFRPHYVGVVTLVMMVVSLVFVFFVLKYGETPHASGGNN